MKKSNSLPLVWFLVFVCLFIIFYITGSMGFGITMVVACPVIGCVLIIYSVIIKDYKSIFWGILTALIPVFFVILGFLRG